MATTGSRQHAEVGCLLVDYRCFQTGAQHLMFSCEEEFQVLQEFQVREASQDVRPMHKGWLWLLVTFADEMMHPLRRVKSGNMSPLALGEGVGPCCSMNSGRDLQSVVEKWWSSTRRSFIVCIGRSCSRLNSTGTARGRE